MARRREGQIQSRPVIPQQVVEQRLLPKKSYKRNDPFTLFFADDWDYIEELDAWLPLTGHINHTPGLNGIGKDGNPAPAITVLLNKGHIPILGSDARLPAEYRNYLSSTPVEGGGFRYTLRCVTYRFSRGGRHATSQTDYAWLWGFRQALHSSGITGDMDPAVFDDKIEVLREQQRRDDALVTSGDMTVESATARKAERDAKIKRWTDAYKRQFGGEAEQKRDARADAAQAMKASAKPKRKAKAKPPTPTPTTEEPANG